jgi:ankyrin repeat protein
MLPLLFLLAQTSVSSATPSALFEAIHQRTSSAAVALINAGADPNSRDIHARTPLHAAESNKFMAIARRIRAAGGR